MRTEHVLDSWSLRGFMPWAWEGSGDGVGVFHQAEVRPLPAPVPGSVQEALRVAGLLPDWRDGLNSRACEWVENRHWVYTCTLPETLRRQGPRKRLVCEGLDGPARILLGGREVASCANAFIPCVVDLGTGDPGAQLGIVFTDQPRSLGQVGRTSRIRDWRSRYTYGWDWTPRVAQIGPHLPVRIEIADGPAIAGLRMRTLFDHQSGRGGLRLNLDLADAAGGVIELTVTGPGGVQVRQLRLPAAGGELAVDDLAVQPWWPNGQGDQPLYQVLVRLLVGAVEHDRREFRTGFRELTWRPCAGAPAGARDWLLTINGRSIFMQGANWVPPRTCFADATADEYRMLVATYRELGCNVLRAWGGAPKPPEVFHAACDEAGILVWQELPLSSSGTDNHPPEDPQLCADMAAICNHYAAVLQHHPSLLLWSGGNELQTALDGSPGIGRPCDGSEPMLVAQHKALAAADPGRRWVPASSSGPRFTAETAEMGRGLHHDVHGPWNHSGDLASWRAYWDADDALLRSETGMPGAQPADLMRRHGGELAWPGDGTNPWWWHVSRCWNQWRQYREAGGDEGSLDAYVAWSQGRQAEFLAYAAAACQKRFPACAGIIIWMGHDCCPCPVNTALIDCIGRPKPAGLALAELFRRHPRM